MPYAPKSPCRKRGCPSLATNGGYCSEHQALVQRPYHDVYKGKTKDRGYGGKWQRARRSYLQMYPLCAECLRQDRLVEATVVDHVVPHRGDMALFWNSDNWQSLCKQCHDSKTARELRQAEKVHSK